MITKEEILKKYGSNPNQKNTFINYDAIDALPDELEPVISEFIFDPHKLHEYFTNVGTEKNRHGILKQIRCIKLLICAV
jgi:hypothetical protein